MTGGHPFFKRTNVFSVKSSQYIPESVPFHIFSVSITSRNTNPITLHSLMRSSSTISSIKRRSSHDAATLITSLAVSGSCSAVYRPRRSQSGIGRTQDLARGPFPPQWRRRRPGHLPDVTAAAAPAAPTKDGFGAPPPSRRCRRGGALMMKSSSQGDDCEMAVPVTVCVEFDGRAKRF